MKCCSPVNYITDIRGHHKIFHINMLKKYIAMEEDDVKGNLTQASNDVVMPNSVSLFDDTDNGEDGFKDGIPFPVLSQKESWRDVT